MVWRKEIVRLILMPIVAFLIEPGGLLGQAGKPNAVPQQSRSLSIELSYYQCADPSNCKCVALTEKDRNDCGECKKWEQKFLSLASKVTLPTDGFSYQTTGSPANHDFLNLASQQAFGISLPRRPDGSPIPTSQLYKNPGRYGWLQLGPDDPKEGALAIWSTMGGLVVKDERNPNQQGLNRLMVLYPSHKLEGELTVGNAVYLGIGEPKFIVPEELFVKNLQVQDEIERKEKPPK